MLKNYKKGFTLIELLVVIAIIGILSSVVLSSLNSARSKGSDAAIKADVANIRAEAEIVYDDLSNSYGTIAMNSACGAIAIASPATHVFNNSNTQKQIDDAVSKNGGTDGKCQANATDYVVAVPLKSNTANAWCVDGHGNSKQIVFATLVTGMDCSLVAASL